MLEGFSILLPTHNMLPWLKICIKSIIKNSKLNNQICIHVDGDVDQTGEWLEKEGLPFTVEDHEGMYSGWNKAGEQASKEHVFLGEDDFYFCPGWDVNLAAWLETLDDTLVVAKCIEPFKGSFPPVVDCGRTPGDFDEDKLLKWVEKNAKHQLVKEPFGMLTVPTDIWRSIGGFDVNYDPTGVGSGDLKMTLYSKTRFNKFRRALDVLVYHFKPCPTVIPYSPLVDHGNVPGNMAYFKRKWGLTPAEAEAIYRTR